jgi:hypothetical protein
MSSPRARFVVPALLLIGLFALPAACSSAAPAVSARTDKSSTQPKFGGTSDPSADGGSAPCEPAPGNYDVPGDGCDNDGDGIVDNPKTCDGAGGSSAADFAHALGICADATTDGYGLVSASFTRGYQLTDAPDDGQHGILPKFGTLTPREGKQLGVLSSGFAAEFDGTSGASFRPGQIWGTDGAAPPGFPKGASGCSQASDVHDMVDLKLELKAPPNATGFKFDFDFYSSEWPSFVCSEYNDGFVAYLTAQSFNNGAADNISFDAKSNPVSVNNGFFDRCTPQTTTGCSGDVTSTSACAGGTSELDGTGFGLLGEGCDDGQVTKGGATGWLSSRAPVKPGETFTLELMIWDTGDGRLDSSILLDNFQWIGGAVTTATERVTSVK